MARKSEITVHRGNDATLNFVCYTTDTGTTPLNITGHAITFTVAVDENPTTTKIITKACTITDGASGTFAAALTAAETNLEPGTYFWDATRTDSGSVVTVGYGAFVVSGVARLPAA